MVKATELQPSKAKCIELPAEPVTSGFESRRMLWRGRCDRRLTQRTCLSTYAPSAQEADAPQYRTPRAGGRGHGHRQHQPAARAGGTRTQLASGLRALRLPCPRMVVSKLEE